MLLKANPLFKARYMCKCDNHNRTMSGVNNKMVLTTKVCFSMARPGIGPSVKKLLHEYNITARSVPGTGPKGNLLKG